MYTSKSLFPAWTTGNRHEKQLISLKGRIVNIHTAKAGEGISYCHTYIAKGDRTIATVPIGYADGYTRSLGNRAFMTVNGQKAPIIGRVCMDQVMIDITGIDDVHTGDEVTVIGDGKNNTLSFDNIAKMTGTINYEVVCLVGKRVPRVYLRHGENIGIMDCIRNSQ